MRLSFSTATVIMNMETDSESWRWQMSNLRYLDCERTRSFPNPQNRDYRLPCPAWCPDDERTRPGYIDFSDPTANGPGNVDNGGADFVDADDIIGEQTINDILGHEWYLRPKHDNTDPVGLWTEEDAFCARSVWTINDNLNGLSAKGNLELLPSHLAACTPNHVINFSRPWTLYQIITVLDGQLEFFATPGTGLTVDANDGDGNPISPGVVCGPNVSIKVAEIAVNLNRITISFTDVCGTTRTVPFIRYDQDTCLYLGVSVDPCEHKLAVYAQTTEFDFQIWWEYPSHNDPAGNANNPQLIEKDQSVCFEIDCEDWWKIQRNKEYGITGVQAQNSTQHTAFFQPPSLWQYFDRLQKVGWNFGSAAGTDVDLHRFQWSNQFRSCAEMALDFDLMTVGKQEITLAAAATTFSAKQKLVVVTGDGGGNTVATITGPMTQAGNVIRLLFVDTNVTITNDNTHAADSVDLSAAFTSADDTVLEIMYDGTSWYEVSRSVN